MKNNNDTDFNKQFSTLSRRGFLKHAAAGIGGTALAGLLGQSAYAAQNAQVQLGQGSLGSPHFRPKAKRVINLFMAGGPSQHDMFDYKPKMKAMFGKDLPEEIRNGQRLTGMTSGQDSFPIAPTKYDFKQYGDSGAWVSELMPYTAKMVDELTFIKSMHTEAINHDPAITYIQTGSQQPGHPSMGSWLSYGLGSENANLPNFVVLHSSWTGRKTAQALYNRLWGSGFLPASHQGVSFQSTGDPILYLTNAKGVNADVRRTMLDGLRNLNQQHFAKMADPSITSRIAQYELANRMQSSVPELTDLKKESKATLDLYGPDVHKPGTFAYNCLMARRLAERGVRFTQIFHRGWDQHQDIAKDLPNQCRDVDQACYALVTDLKSRGLLEDTIVTWGGEFGRTIYCQGKLTKENYGRDHHPRSFTTWVAGGGFKPGITYGESDEFGYNIVKDPVHIRDLNRTVLHQLGIDHKRLSVKHQGLDQTLTGVEESHLIKGIIS
ncbi:DUF1501 domain-containing protein [Paraglaciecola aquimarina]|uniref:DUF1501 domain-containing protein n=1 Tax=Paraglaciecola aquimarina TaxID=1235557 RepID=A0ABU3SSA7_9ALTE|nr:DUF1501 domain-containing protein [Paraglaciecola aquimarina]MDU0352869.1 DUF1501 domain-containing protein [Paraglaciecola aquimarina]